MSITYIDDPGAGSRLSDTLDGESRIAVDCEAAGFHRYSDRLCLVQVSTSSRHYLVDPLSFDPAPALRRALEDPGTEVILHGGDFDIRLLSRDLDIAVRGVFDTQIAASLLGERALGLSSLLDNLLDIRLPKGQQRADWARRPLPEELRRYAANDTRHLHDLADLLRERLQAAGRLEWAEEEFRILESVRWDPDEDEDPVTGVKKAWKLELREVATLREALEWRDRIARNRDRAPFRVAGDGPLLEVARERPESLEELRQIQGLSAGLIRGEGDDLLQRIRKVDDRPEAELEPYPERSDGRRERPDPEVEARTNRLRQVRNRRAEELEIDRGTLLPNSTLEEIARELPRDPSGLERVSGVKRWQVEALGQDLLDVLVDEAAA